MIIRPCIAIPVYNNCQTIRQVVIDCLSQTEYPVLVIDDGSDLPVSELLSELPAFASARLNLLRLATNRGKGAAIQAGFRFAVEKNFTHLLTMDGDGQHLASELPKLLSAIAQNPWALIIGNRRLTEATVPQLSKFGRVFSNFWVKYQTGFLVQDSQSGLRAYPLFHVQHMTFWTRRYDFEIEVLIRLLWKNVIVHEVPIQVFYPPQNQRVSHFRKFWDNARISALNTCLVILSLLRGNREPAKMALALGLGVFVGCTPFFGFHTLIALALAVLFRLNAPLLWIGTQVSLPFLAPFLVVSSIAIGRAWDGKPFSPDWSQANLSQVVVSFQDWLTGSLILGLFLGTLAGVATWAICRRMKIKKRRPWTGKSRGGKFGNWFLKTLTHKLGIRAGYFCLLFVAPYFFLFSPQGRRASLEYWRIIQPDLTSEKRARAWLSWHGQAWRVLKHFYRFGTILLDRIYQRYFSTPKFQTESNGFENISQALAMGQGAILLGAHVGAWELAATYLPDSTLEQNFLFVQYLAPGAKTSGREEQARRSNVLYVNEEESALMKIYRSLQAGKMICLMGDRPMDSHYELVNFFDRLAPFASTPFKIAVACQVPIVISFGFKKDRQKYQFMALTPKYYRYESGKDKNSQMLGWIQEYAQELATALKEFPDQWFNFFPFWSVLPALPDHSPDRRGRNHLMPEWNRQTTGSTAREFDPTKIA